MRALVSSAWEHRPDNSLSLWGIRFFKWFHSKPSVIWWLISVITIPWYKKFWKWTLMCSSISSLYVVIASRRIAWWCFLDSFFFLIERLRCDCVLILHDLWAREWVVWHISKYLHTLFSVSSPLNFRGAPLNLFCGIESNLLVWVWLFHCFIVFLIQEDFFPSPPKMEENTVRQVHTAVLSMYKGDHRATQWLNAFGRSKVCSILTREM